MAEANTNWINQARDCESPYDAFDVARQIVRDAIDYVETAEAKAALIGVHRQIMAAVTIQEMQAELSDAHKANRDTSNQNESE